MKISPLVVICSFVTTQALASSWETDYNAAINGFYGYTDYASPYNKLHKQNNLNSSLNLYGRATYEHNEDYLTSVIGYFSIDSAKKLENYNQGIWGETIYAMEETPFGDILVGQNANVAYNFSVGAPKVGSYHLGNDELVNFITNPNWYQKGHKSSYKTLNSTYINTDGASLKASYITPEYKGLKLGVTYVPETYSRSGLVAENAEYKDKSAYILGAYGAWDILGYELETSLGFADYHKNDTEYSAGLSLYRKGWTFGASYRQTKTDKKDYAINKENLFDAYREGRAYNLGLSYAFGPLTTGVTYFESKSDKTSNRNKIFSFSNSYQYNKNTAFSFTMAHMNAVGEDKSQDKNTKGYAFILGVELSL